MRQPHLLGFYPQLLKDGDMFSEIPLYRKYANYQFGLLPGLLVRYLP